MQKLNGVVGAIAIVATLGGCALLQPTASPQEVTAYVDACEVKVRAQLRAGEAETLSSAEPFSEDANRAAAQLRYEVAMDRCAGPFYAEQARRQTNINTQARADADFFAALPAAVLGGVIGAALAPRTVYVVPVRCGRWGCW